MAGNQRVVHATSKWLFGCSTDDNSGEAHATMTHSRCRVLRSYCDNVAVSLQVAVEAVQMEEVVVDVVLCSL